jgi:hypothetical protein
MSLVWEYARVVSSGITGAAPAGVAHYDDETIEAFYVGAGLLRGCDGTASQGHWRDAVYGSAYPLSETYSATVEGVPQTTGVYSAAEWDQASVGLLMGAAVVDGALACIRYVYARDISPAITDGRVSETLDSPIASLSLSVDNVAPELFEDPFTLFLPGARISVAASVGDSLPYPIGMYYIDEIAYDAWAETVSVAARNACGFLLNDEETSPSVWVLPGGAYPPWTDFYESILGARVKKSVYQSEAAPEVLELILNGGQIASRLRLVQNMNEFTGWRIREGPDGTVYVGPPEYIGGYLPNTNYFFERGSEVFSRKTRKSADGVKTIVAMHYEYTDPMYPDLPVKGTQTAPVFTDPRWNIAGRYLEMDAPPGYRAASAQSHANDIARWLVFTGITEEFVSPLRPHLLCGDIAAIYDEGEVVATTLGVITSITHRFGKSGCSTSFAVSSGGAVLSESSGVVTTAAMIIEGAQRQQRLTDAINKARTAAEKQSERYYAAPESDS